MRFMKNSQYTMYLIRVCMTISALAREACVRGAVAASWGVPVLGSFPGSPGFSSFPAPLTLTLGARRCPQVPALMPHRSRW